MLGTEGMKGFRKWCTSLVVIALCPACGGTVAGANSADGAISANGGGNSNNGDDDAASWTSFSAATVTAAQDQCASGISPPAAVPATTVGELRAQIVGAWWLCSGNSTGALLPGPIVITSDGRWTYLVSDGSGGLVVSSGPRDTFTYRIETDFEGQPIIDGAPGQVLGTTTTVLVDTGMGTVRLQMDPRQDPPQLWMSDDATNFWAYTQL